MAWRVQTRAAKVSRMNLYKRTAAGNAAALNPRLPLSRTLRALLVSVDGRTQQQTYVENLASFGDVSALLDSLLIQGYVEIITTDNDEFLTVPGLADWQDTGALAIERQDEGTTPAVPFESRAEMSGTHRTAALSSETLPPKSFQFKPRLPPSTALPATVAASSTAAARPGMRLSAAQYQLRNAISLMSDFVTSHLPDESIEIVLTLEGLNSLAQVVACLNDYKAMIAPAGTAVTAHLNELRELLSRG